MNNLKIIVEKIFKKDDRLWNEDKTELNQTLFFDLIENIDENIIDLLLKNRNTRKKFFVKIKDIFVFKVNDFRFFMEENKIDNSYTKYKNRIGLTDSDKFLKDTNDVVLDFPYKDCVLEGGQSDEDGMDTYFEYEEEKVKIVNKKNVIEKAVYKKKQAKRKEVFFNQVLAKDEIDRLLDDKAFINWKRHAKKGEEAVKKIKRDANGTVKENLIIKGNNLLALHSLKRQFAGKVKLIYIDPPYNTGNDGFKYNDNFNHSTWLTFMKNRLEVARELLRDDGIIFVQCDDNEQAYLKVLMDEVFGRNNFVNNFVWQKKSSGGQHSNFVLDFHEYILAFTKNIVNLNPFLIKRSKKQMESFKYRDEFIKERGKYLVSPLKSWLDYRKTLIYPIECPDKSVIKTQWVCSESTYKKLKIDGRIEFKKNQDGKWAVYKKQYIFDRDGKVKSPSLILDVAQNINGTKEMQKLFGEKKFGNPKPEALIKRIVEMATKENDIILDFFSGSGTTGAVAHKMNRQYILIEQMGYINELPEARLKKVIAGEQGGISKAVNWKGGGDFIYCELAELNEKAKEKINSSKSLKELKKLFDILYNKYFLNYNLKIKEFKERVIKEDNFKNLSFDEQKRMFLIMLDLNQMYVCKTEMADIQFGIGEEDQKLTYDFYNKSK
ncbi:site-specific DNA-methyltransferase [Candidatus Parcubacteria bacterium]|nr:site-specific DNA-methyltransferase [Candidatus Parcubacteria bacterium]